MLQPRPNSMFALRRARICSTKERQWRQRGVENAARYCVQFLTPVHALTRLVRQALYGQPHFRAWAGTGKVVIAYARVVFRRH